MESRPSAMPRPSFPRRRKGGVVDDPQRRHLGDRPVALGVPAQLRLAGIGMLDVAVTVPDQLADIDRPNSFERRDHAAASLRVAGDGMCRPGAG